MTDPQLVALSALVERPGWSKAAVARLLPRADHVEAFPTYVRRYYRLARVEAVERSREWQRWQEERSKRMEAR